MFPINNLKGIEDQENNCQEKHVIVFLFLKPSDEKASQYLQNLNYLHHRSGKYYSI